MVSATLRFSSVSAGAGPASAGHEETSLAGIDGVHHGYPALKARAGPQDFPGERIENIDLPPLALRRNPSAAVIIAR
jgi:hypothetical protein